MMRFVKRNSCDAPFSSYEPGFNEKHQLVAAGTQCPSVRTADDEFGRLIQEIPGI